MAEETTFPDVYHYHNYREYLRDYFDQLKATERGFSLRKVARETNTAISHLSMVLKGTRGLSEKGLENLFGVVRLNRSEKSYLKLLRTIGESNTPEERVVALRKAHKFLAYRRYNTQEIEAYKILTNWYFVAIRELVMFADFQADPKWIQNQLGHHVPIKEIKVALDFLIENQFIQKNKKGEFFLPEKPITCSGGVYRVAISKFQSQMLELAAKAFDVTPKEERDISSQTFAIPFEKFDEIKEILADAREKISAVSQENKNSDSIYHVALAAFPIAKSKRGKK